ncbi:MAG: hypothetical protein RIF41_09215 [Polyangiaceae bacterium]
MGWWPPWGRSRDDEVAEPITFFVTASKEPDFDDRFNLWTVSALRIPGVLIEKVRARYEEEEGWKTPVQGESWDRRKNDIYWRDERVPDEIALELVIAKRLALKADAERTQRFTATLGATATVLAASVTAVGSYKAAFAKAEAEFAAAASSSSSAVPTAPASSSDIKPPATASASATVGVENPEPPKPLRVPEGRCKDAFATDVTGGGPSKDAWKTKACKEVLCDHRKAEHSPPNLSFVRPTKSPSGEVVDVHCFVP